MRLDGWGERERERERAESHKDRKWRLLDSTEEEEEEAGVSMLWGDICLVYSASQILPLFLDFCHTAYANVYFRPTDEMKDSMFGRELFR